MLLTKSLLVVFNLLVAVTTLLALRMSSSAYILRGAAVAFTAGLFLQVLFLYYAYIKAKDMRERLAAKGWIVNSWTFITTLSRLRLKDLQYVVSKEEWVLSGRYSDRLDEIGNVLKSVEFRRTVESQQHIQSRTMSILKDRNSRER